MLTIYTDGASRGNPGPAACAYTITNSEGKLLDKSVEFLGKNTNNVAEYTAVIRALKKAGEYQDKEIRLFSDSQLVIRQITGRYRINKPHLKVLYDEVMALCKPFTITWGEVPRENPGISQCDKLCNEELDRHTNLH
ncbi:ribonuclease HI family protein [Methanospirillum stamsii]|uniref:Ribonuclease H n=1 Tax=Methanospirillum stamsii TaxID=1277351 RepID=A0A2V2N7H4_9EURY|nr:ribonuclease HI family protein [Methanospirillum stamsii]PWR74600.1 ribonuclease H [Methanospirillum stamsii]